MDLPKGLVEDDKRIYSEVANLPTVPEEVIRTIWKAYTTTNKQLYDPTAHRLEHFWWHVWGSDKLRKLKPATIASMWQKISSGPTFVPLKGSPNRYEPPAQESRSNSQSEGDVLQQAPLPPHVPETGTTTGAQSTLKELSASSSRPPPPHPILKKSRGDSKSGPRPTARFVSPAASGDEEVVHAVLEEEASSDSSASDGLEMRTRASTSADARKRNKKKASKQTGPTRGKRFVVATTAKRRPVLPRRQSSQSSNGSETTSKSGGFTTSSRSAGSQSQQSSVTSNPDRLHEGTAAPETCKDTGTPPMSAKALGKQPAYKFKQPSPQLKSEPAVMKPDEQAHTQLPKPWVSAGETPKASKDLETLVEGKQLDNGVIAGAEGEGSGTRSTQATARRTSAASSQEGSVGAPKMQRSTSNTDSQRPRQASLGRNSSYGLLSNATASMSTVAAQGQMSKSTDVPDASALQAWGSLPDEPPSPYLPRNGSSASLFMPTIPSPTPSVPLARSRSQLTLLLEREKERSAAEKGRMGMPPRSRS